MIKLILLGFVTKVNIKGTDIVGKFAMGFAMFVLTPFLVTTVMGSGRTIQAIAGGTIYPKGRNQSSGPSFSRLCFGTRVDLIVLGRARMISRIPGTRTQEH